MSYAKHLFEQGRIDVAKLLIEKELSKLFPTADTDWLRQMVNG